MSSCWNYLAGAFGHIRGLWNWTKEDLAYNTHSRCKLQLDAQAEAGRQWIVGYTPTTASTSTATVLITHPRITPGPAIVRRKVGGVRWDAIHEGIQGQKRDATICQSSGYILCPKSLSGGCCPSDRICDTSSCLPNTAPATACGVSGRIACAISDGGKLLFGWPASQF